MDWILPIIVLVTAYVLVAYYIHKNRLWPAYITFYGPFMAIKTEKVGFFDRSIPYSTFLRVYGTLGVVMVVIVSVLMTVMLFISVQHIVIQRPPLTAANELKNVLAIPGVHLHDYGKSPRPGRKLGHVTVTATDDAELTTRLHAVNAVVSSA